MPMEFDPALPLLAAGSATERERSVTALVPDFHQFPVDAVARRDAFLVSEAVRRKSR